MFFGRLIAKSARRSFIGHVLKINASSGRKESKSGTAVAQ